MKKNIKFNFYSKKMFQTVTVFGAMIQNWSGKDMFKVNKIINNNLQEIIALEIHEEAFEHFNINILDSSHITES